MRILPMFCRVRSYPTATQDVPWPGWLDIADAEAQHADLPFDEHRSLSSVQRAAILDPEERQWVHVQPWLESKGYMLRPRFRPGWRPSWSESATKDDLPKHEDSVPHNVRRSDRFVLQYLLTGISPSILVVVMSWTRSV